MASSTLEAGRRDTTWPQDHLIGWWLVVCAAMIFAMAVIGAITRLTESGLSIMEWAPLSGALPPLSQAEWQRLFALYQQIPEYQELNRGMSLEAFKSIFWWEYIHRLWGRLIGLVFALPLLWFLATGRIRPALRPHLFAMLALGAVQGGMGWYMVASGFADRTDVSQYRLVVHLLMALGIYAYVLWIAFTLLAGRGAERAAEPGASLPGLRSGLLALLLLLVVTIASGGFVAGTNAGLIYDSFPLMGGDLVPYDYYDAALGSWLANSFENPAAIQFHHRWLAMITVAVVLWVWLLGRRAGLAGRARQAFALLLLAAAAQLALGVGTLLLAVPVSLGALHQAGAIVLLTAALWARFCLRAPRPV